MRLQLLALAAAAALLANPAQADVVNGGFSSGDLTGWSYSDGFAEVVTEADDVIVSPPFGMHYEPTDGDGYFARLTAGNGPDGLGYSLLSNTFTLNVRSLVSVDLAFLAFDYMPYNDNAYVQLSNGTNTVTIFRASVRTVGDNGHTPWVTSRRALDAGTWTLEAGIRDGREAGYSSQLLVDNLTFSAIVPGAVPEPSTWAMMILGLGAAGAVLRRRRATGAATA